MKLFSKNPPLKAPTVLSNALSQYYNSAQKADLALLRRFEPIICFTKGEKFFPMDIEPYIQLCSLWAQKPEQEAVCIVSAEKLDMDTLSKLPPYDFGTVYFLKVAEPLSPVEYASYNLQKLRLLLDEGEPFHSGLGRLARVGYTARFADALFSLLLFTRGRVSGATAAAADNLYKQVMNQHEHYCYYGRVIRENGWVILQYWFFYFFNNWRSGFTGANDHEADWETISIYLYEEKTGQVEPEWVAYASHDYAGNDIRRHWQDPEVKKQGEHPIIYAGAGSHASYYTAGEYLAELEISFLSPLAKMFEKGQKFWHKTLRQYRSEETDSSLEDEKPTRNRIFRIPFVDYARGDGIRIGPGQIKTWDAPRLLNPPPSWVTNYRGLWGLYARDPFSGEDAPAGPMYNRNGSVRQVWHNPLGWAGLDSVAPPQRALEITKKQQQNVANEQLSLKENIKLKYEALLQYGVEAEAMCGNPYLKKQYETHQEDMRTLSQEIDAILAKIATTEALLKALESYETALREGQSRVTRAHIQRVHQPTTEVELRLNRLAEIWAAASVGIMLIGLVSLTVFASNYLTAGLIAFILVVIFIEASFRGHLIRLVTRITIFLAILATLVIIYDFFWMWGNISRFNCRRLIFSGTIYANYGVSIYTMKSLFLCKIFLSQII